MTNLTSGGSTEQIIQVVNSGAMKPICDLLTVKETKMVLVLLDCVKNILVVRTFAKSEFSKHLAFIVDHTDL